MVTTSYSLAVSLPNVFVDSIASSASHADDTVLTTTEHESSLYVLLTDGKPDEVDEEIWLGELIVADPEAVGFEIESWIQIAYRLDLTGTPSDKILTGMIASTRYRFHSVDAGLNRLSSSTVSTFDYKGVGWNAKVNVEGY